MMRVLLTNDDGYLAPGMLALLSAVRAIGWDPIVVAPTSAAMGASRSRQSWQHLEWTETRLDSTQCYHVAGTPAACVVLALTSGLLDNVDICISGINAGENLGAGLTISGTFGAALEAHSLGIRAIAISRQYEGPITSDPLRWDWSYLQGAVPRALRWCTDQPDWHIANLNIPNPPFPTDIARTKISQECYFDDRYDLPTKTIVSQIGYDQSRLEADDDIYQFAVKGHISATLLSGTFS